MTTDNEFNPYASPSSRAANHAKIRNGRVDGKCVVVTNGTELPLRCVVTNANCDATDQRLRKLRYAPTFRLVISHRSCRLLCCVSAARRKRRLLLLTVAFLGIVGTFWMLFGELVIGGIVAAVFVLAVPPDRLKIVNHRNGEFWIKGFNGDFLDSIVAENGWHRH